MKTILFVDDEPWYHEAIRIKLESKGFECLTVTDMSAALELLATREVSVVVTDIMMPAGKNYPKIDSQETGFFLVKALRSTWGSIAIVCLSVIGDESKIRSLRRFGVSYLRKGEVPLETVVQTIERAAGQGGAKVWKF
jgi:CheY-like chemotaxis protein